MIIRQEKDDTVLDKKIHKIDLNVKIREKNLPSINLIMTQIKKIS